MTEQSSQSEANLTKSAVASNADPELRFEFGKNWKAFLRELTAERIVFAEKCLIEPLELNSLTGMSFLDIGCGSGLMSLAARQLGATVHSFDYDQEAVACALVLRDRYFSVDSGDSSQWTIEQGSILDSSLSERLDKFDIVYSWGVLHHTGRMWVAIENAAKFVKPGGRLFLALYNDQGWKSKVWWFVKRLYVGLPSFLRWLVLVPAFVRLWGPRFISDTLRGSPSKAWKEYGHQRGMSPWRDVVDWVGGFPFEVARPDEVFRFVRGRGFSLEHLVTRGAGLGCNEFVFKKNC